MRHEQMQAFRTEARRQAGRALTEDVRAGVAGSL